jgi:hypothetical protein
MSRIHKTFFGSYIDLDKIVNVSKAYFIDRMGYGGWFVAVDINCQLLESAIHYERHISDDEHHYADGKFRLKLVDNSSTTIPPEDENEILAVQNLQKEIDVLVLAWRQNEMVSR